jgi:hypothetical protein
LPSKAYDTIGVYFTVDTLKIISTPAAALAVPQRLFGTALKIKPFLAHPWTDKIDAVKSVIFFCQSHEAMVDLVRA